jgi:hypothetical protein
MKYLAAGVGWIDMGTRSEGVWPRNEPILASYDISDVIVYLKTFKLGLMALAQRVQNAFSDATIVASEPPSMQTEWTVNLPVQLENTADWKRASVAYVQLLETFESFAEPFEGFLYRAAELHTIPYVDIDFDACVLKCITVCLTASRVNSVREAGFGSGQELSEKVRCTIIVADLLLRGYKDRFVKSDRS